MDNGGIKLNERIYDDPGTGSMFLAPSPARTRLCLFITGIDAVGLQKAVWSIPYQSGAQVADFTIFGKHYSGASAGGEERATGIGGILATGFWSNNWNYEERASYLK